MKLKRTIARLQVKKRQAERASLEKRERKLSLKLNKERKQLDIQERRLKLSEAKQRLSKAKAKPRIIPKGTGKAALKGAKVAGKAFVGYMKKKPKWLSEYK
jgi:hypothetical protein